MPSQFFGLTIASSGLSAYQAALNTTANNISNEQTKGYSRQAANPHRMHFVSMQNTEAWVPALR